MNDDEIKSARLGPDDAARMAEIEKICFDEPWSEDQCRKALLQPVMAAFGLFEAERLLAYISLYLVEDEMEVLNLAVRPQWRRRGFGRRLLSLALQAGRKMGIQKVRLEVRQGNFGAIALYGSMGFTPCGKRPRYYANGEDAIIQALDLAAGPKKA